MFGTISAQHKKTTNPVVWEDCYIRQINTTLEKVGASVVHHIYYTLRPHGPILYSTTLSDFELLD